MESEPLMLSQIVDALQEGGKQNPRLWEKYLLKPLHHHYDNAHEEMTLKFNILAKREGGGGLHNNITSFLAVAQEVELFTNQKVNGLIPVCMIGQDTEP